MNKAIQISRAEHNLKQVEKNTIVASRKKLLANASITVLIHVDLHNNNGELHVKVHTTFIRLAIQTNLLSMDFSSMRQYKPV